MVSTLDSESSDPSSNLGGTYYFSFSQVQTATLNVVLPARSQVQYLAVIAQLGERQTEDLKVPGSIPGRGIFIITHTFLFFPLKQHDGKDVLSSVTRYIKTKAPARFELAISCLLDRRFNQLSHGAMLETAMQLYSKVGEIQVRVKKKEYSPNVGLEPTTLRFRVSCSTD